MRRISQVQRITKASEQQCEVSTSNTVTAKSRALVPSILLSLAAGTAEGFVFSPKKATVTSYPPAKVTRRGAFVTDRCAVPSTALRMSAAPENVISSNEDLLPGICSIEKGNDDLYDKLEPIRMEPYFRFYSVDILASCEYMPQELFECYTEKCEIYPVDEDEIPQGLVNIDRAEFDFDLDGWARWDMPTEDYYDTQQFPEGYTGYDGSDIWNFIHNRICFGGYQYDDDHWKADFNKAVSGLHSMISAQVLLDMKERLDAGDEFGEDEIWRDPVAEFDRRLGPRGETPMALENLYFTYMLMLAAASRAKDRLLADCNSGKIDAGAAGVLRSAFSSTLLEQDDAGRGVDAASKKLLDHAVKDSDSAGALWEARMRSRELLRIMNCVQCNKCRFHGKISAMGLSTALQILVGRSGEGGDPNRIHRVELASLMTTLHKFSSSIKFCQSMQQQ